MYSKAIHKYHFFSSLYATKSNVTIKVQPH